ncbi:MAG: nuclease-related domain-containing protein [Bacillota bacterium]|jgi:hypothetical protein
MARVVTHSNSWKKELEALNSLGNSGNTKWSLKLYFVHILIFFGLLVLFWPLAVAYGLFVWFKSNNFNAGNSREKIIRQKEMIRRGANGEEKVFSALLALNDDWYIFNDCCIKGYQIDQIVVGPGGIFCLEVKNYSTVKIDGYGNWMFWKNKKWNKMNVDPVKQNEAHVKGVTKLLRENRIGLRVSSIVVLANRNAKLELHRNKIGETRIVVIDELVNSIYRMSTHYNITDKEVRNIVEVIFNNLQEYRVKTKVV